MTRLCHISIILFLIDLEMFRGQTNDSDLLSDSTIEGYESVHFKNNGDKKVTSYSEWGRWSACQGGRKTRRRHCLRRQICGDSLRIEVARCKSREMRGREDNKEGHQNKQIPFKVVGLKQLSNGDVQKRFIGFSPWSSWSTCSKKCTTVRKRHCQKWTICGRKVIKQSAYCYLEGSLCHLWIRGRMHRRKDQGYNVVESLPSPVPVIHSEDSRSFSASVPTCGRLGKYQGTSTNRLRARMQDMLRIIGGRPAPPGKWIWQVAVLNRFKEAFCGGTLISLRWVVTAAHCVRKRLYVRLGEHDLLVRNYGELEMRVTEAVIHPQYDPDTVVNDVAMLRSKLNFKMNSVPIALNKAAMRKYEDLEIPCDDILASYVWVDGTGINLRSKDRTFDFVPKTNKDLPIWYFDGSNTAQASTDNSDTFIFPEVIYHDPFRRGSHILVLADTYQHNYQPTPTNHRKGCVILTEKADVEEPWFGFNQEFFLTTTDARPLGWPPGGYPAPPGPYYCAIGANKIVARDLMEAFYRCCLYAGVHLNGINPGTTPSQWNFQVGPSPGLRSADDLWMARYILARLAEEYGTVATFEPQPIEDWPGNGTFVYFSSKDMREEDGILVIERAIDKLARRHGAHINEYDANNGADNARRLTGKNGMPHIRDFTAGVANRSCSVRIPRQVSEDKRGYLEDRRPAANADPYRVISIMLRTCIFDE